MSKIVSEMTSAWTLKPVTFPIPPEIQVHFDKFKIDICLDKKHIIHCYYQFVYLITIMLYQILQQTRFLTFHKEMAGFTDFLAFTKMLHHKSIMIMTLAQDLLSLHQMTPV